VHVFVFGTAEQRRRWNSPAGLAHAQKQKSRTVKIVEMRPNAIYRYLTVELEDSSLNNLSWVMFELCLLNHKALAVTAVAVSDTLISAVPQIETEMLWETYHCIISILQIESIWRWTCRTERRSLPLFSKLLFCVEPRESPYRESVHR